ncbi:MAG: phage holin family protein [Clostridiales bacterium]|nr:phage holin family protein [Clostridiales bacterium]
MTFAFGMLVCVWLIINEILSVLENLSAIGVPMPAFLTKITGGLKVTIENAAKAEDE